MGCLVVNCKDTSERLSVATSDNGEHLSLTLQEDSERLRVICSLICCMQSIEQLYMQLYSADNLALYDANGVVLYAKPKNIIIS